MGRSIEYYGKTTKKDKNAIKSSRTDRYPKQTKKIYKISKSCKFEQEKETKKVDKLMVIALGLRNKHKKDNSKETK